MKTTEAEDTKVYVVLVSGPDENVCREIRQVLQRVTDDFLIKDIETASFGGFGLHIRGCGCGNCDGSGGVPGGLVTVHGFREQSLSPRKRFVFSDVQVGCRVLLNLRNDPIAKALGILKKEAWGKVIDCHVSGGWHVTIDDVIGNDHDGSLGLVYVLRPNNMDRVMEVSS